MKEILNYPPTSMWFLLFYSIKPRSQVEVSFLLSLREEVSSQTLSHQLSSTWTDHSPQPQKNIVDYVLFPQLMDDEMHLGNGYCSCWISARYCLTLLASSTFLSLDFTATPRFLSQSAKVTVFTLLS